jgi:hypothetical protein
MATAASVLRRRTAAAAEELTELGLRVRSEG